MQSVYRLLLLAAMAPCLTIIVSVPVEARQTIATGSIATGFDVRDRTYEKASTNDEDQQKIFISPTIMLSSKGAYDLLSLRYSPRLNYDFFDNENSIDHNLNLRAQRTLSSRWSLSLTDAYKYSDDSEGFTTSTTGDQPDDTDDSTDNDTSDELSRDQTGRKFWTNSAGIRSSYALFENTALNGGYTYSVLRNEQGDDGSDYNEYDKHAFSTGIAHGFNAYWRSTLDLNYTRGLYKDRPTGSTSTSSSSSDLQQYGVGAGVDYIQSAQDFFPLHYNLSETTYDESTRRGTLAHEVSLGWNHAFDPQTRLTVGAGPSFAETEGLDGQWGYNAHLTFSKKFQHVSYSLQLNKQFETNNFSGTDESGLTDTYNARANLSYQYDKDLGFNFFGRYTKESQIDPQGIYRDAVTGVITETGTGDNTYDKDIYETGLGLRYAFGRWYSAGIKYSYYISDGQLESDQYNEHRVMLTLDMTRELFQW